MAHMIDFSNSRANMAFMGETPWHGLGHKLPEHATRGEWTSAAGLGWEALKLPTFYQMPGEPNMRQSDDNFHIVRADTGASLGVMSGRYQPVQPAEVMEFFQNFILSDDRFALETAGSLKGGKVIWALAKFCETMKAGGDKHVPYVLLTTSYNGSLATTAQATMIRVVCNNTLTASVWAKDAASVKVPHSRKWTPQVASDAHERLETVAREFDTYKGLADAFAQQRMSKAETERFLARVFYGEDAQPKDASGKAKAQFDALFGAYADTVSKDGTPAGTAWTALNAVTRFVDHDRNTRVTDKAAISEGQARMASAFYGSGAVMKREAVKLLQAA